MHSAPGRSYPWVYRMVVGLLRPPLLWFTRRHWSGVENLPSAGGFIAVSNHVTNLDPLTFAHFLVDNDVPVKFLAKKELFKIPFFGRILTMVGHIPVHRGTAKAADSLRDAEAALRGGECVAVFPEGTLTHDPGAWPMRGKTGVARLALATRVPVIPIAQWGAHRIVPRFAEHFATLIPQRVDVVAGPPVDLSDLYDRPIDAAALRTATDRIMERLTEELAAIRGETPPTRFWDRSVDGDSKATYLAEKAAERAQRAERRTAGVRAAFARARGTLAGLAKRTRR